MKYLDRTWPDPATNLAADEALLDHCEANPGQPGVLRFYESPAHCVVLGYGNRLASEADADACAAAGIPILRRVSGGGTVLLGPGCLAYTLVLPISSDPALETVTGTNRFVMERQRAACEAVLQRPVAVEGYTDLVCAGRKFSGNAQRRRRHFLLFHGTFLLRFDLGLISRALRMPTLRPEYRADRSHEDFVMNLDVPSSRMKEALRATWHAEEPWHESLDESLAALMADRYGDPEWHRRR